MFLRVPRLHLEQQKERLDFKNEMRFILSVY